MKNLKVVAAGWEGEFNATLEGWTYEKYTPGKDGTNEPNRFYLDKFPEDRPTDAEATRPSSRAIRTSRTWARSSSASLDR